MIQPLNELNLHGPDLLWPLVACVVTGVALGIMFFGSLWWTTKQMHRFQYPALWFMTGFILRISTVLVGMYWTSDGQWQRLVACFVGFLVARVAVFRLTNKIQNNPQTAEENQQEVKGKPHGS